MKNKTKITTCPRWAKNLAEASRITRISRSTLGTYRADGCGAFKSNGKIDLDELSAWMAVHGKDAGKVTSELQQARIRLLNAQSARTERENAMREGKTADKTEVIYAVAKVQSAMFYQLDRLKSELPPLLKGLSESEIFKRFSEKIDELKSDLARQYMALENGTDGEPEKTAA